MTRELLSGVQIRYAGAAAAICRDHLRLLGAQVDPHECVTPAGDAAARLEICDSASPARSDDSFGCTIGWGPNGASGPSALSSEALIQAACGLMSVHGRDTGVPRRMHGDIATTTSGVLASQGVLASLLARRRGHDVARLETSVFSAGLFLLNHHIAIATCGGRFPDGVQGIGTPPPFATRDGQWVELEALSVDAWRAFWHRLGVEPGSAVARAWLPYVYRYLAGGCALPAELHHAAMRHTFTEIREAAETFGIAMCAIRSTRSWPPGTPNRMRAADIGAAVPWSLTSMDDAWRARDPQPESGCGQPLSGVRVIELGSRLQAPLTGLLLQMLGADVVKVEPPGGDFGRGSPPLAGSVGAAYLAYNRAKRRVELDYKTTAGRAGLLDLVRHSDVFVHNLRAGRAELLQLDADTLGRYNPALVHAYTSGWGDAPSPPSDIAGDYLVQAHAGCGDELNALDQPPFPSRVTLVDVMGGLLGCEAVLAALLMRETTRRGCRVQSSLLGAASVLRQGTRGRPGLDPLCEPQGTAGGHLVVHLDDDAQRTTMLAVIGCAPGTQSAEALRTRLMRRSAAEWQVLLADAGIGASVVRTDLRDLTTDPVAVAALEQIDDACWAPSAPWRFLDC